MVKPKPSRTKGHLSSRTAFVREIIKEVSGYACYGQLLRSLLTGFQIVLHLMNAVLLSSSETVKTSVRASWPRSALALLAVQRRKLNASRISLQSHGELVTKCHLPCFSARFGREVCMKAW